MKHLLVAALGLGLGAGCLPTLAQEAPRQLGGAPALPTYTPRPAPAPRQLGTAPAAPAAAVAPDSTRPAAAVAPTPAPVAAPPQAVPGPAPASPAENRPYIMGNNTRPTRYQVGLRNGSLYNVYDVEVKAPLFGHSYLLLDGQRRVDLSDVGFYEDETGHYVRTTLPNSSREATLRREKTGRISLYATYNTSYSPGYGGPGFGYGGFGYGGLGGFGGAPYGGYRTTKTEYFSKDSGPIQNLTTRNLLLATTDNAGAQELLTQARRSQTAVTVAYVAGGGLLAYGLYQSFKPGGGGASPLIYLAIPVLAVPIFLQGKQASAQRQAIALYNSGAR